jgi:hypothetical protein
VQEYRPFFTQGANFLNPSAASFSSPTSPNNEVFYSPRIGPFDAGAKIEGAFGQQSFGLLGFRGFDETTGNKFNDIAYGYKHALADRTFEYWADGVMAHHSLAGDDTTTDVGLFGRNASSGFEWGDGQTFERGSWVPDTHVAHSSNTFIDVNKPNYLAVVVTTTLAQIIIPSMALHSIPISTAFRAEPKRWVPPNGLKTTW